jgi:hypothetical protein
MREPTHAGRRIDDARHTNADSQHLRGRNGGVAKGASRLLLDGVECGHRIPDQWYVAFVTGHDLGVKVTDHGSYTVATQFDANHVARLRIYAQQNGWSSSA